jgi:hypothetical protein
MGFGSNTLLIFGLFLQGFPVLSFKVVIYIFWLAIINTALVFQYATKP